MTSAPPPAPPSLDPPYHQPPPPPPGPPARGQLRRSRTDKVIGGVAGGLARYSGIDPLLWRVGFVALVFAGGTGILVYLLLWLLMPAAPGDPAVEQPAEPAGPRSPVPGVTIAGLLIVLGVLALVARFTDWEPGARGVLGAALLVVGLGLVAAAFSGGRTAKGGLITLGIVLSLALLFASAVPWDHRGGPVGDQRYWERDAELVQPVYSGGIGDLTVDLSQVDVSDLAEVVSTRVEAGVGDVEVLLPRTADVEITVDPGIGSVRLFGTGRSGGFFPGTGSGSWVDDGDPEIVLEINAGVGDVEVSRG